MPDLGLKSFDKLYPMMIRKYQDLIVDQNASEADKINSIILKLNALGKLSNDVVRDWNTVYQWAMNDGLNQDVSNKIELMKSNGELDTILNGIFNTLTGDMTTLHTTAKDTLVNSINEVDDLAKSNQTQLAQIAYYPENYKLPADTDYTNAFSAMINAIKTNGKGTILLAQGKTYVGNINTNECSNLVITGGGTLQGIINLYGKDMTTGNKFTDGSHNVLIDNITIDAGTTRNAINVKWYMGVTITNTTIINALKAINFETVDVSQHSSRFIITNNRLIDCNYGLYSYSTMAQGSFQVGDVTFNDNQCETRSSTFSFLYGVYAYGFDGFVCKGNVFFFTIGTTNIYMNNFNWVNIEGNQLFVPSDHGVRCENGQNLTIVNNKVAWSGKQSIYVNNVQTANINGNQLTQQDDNGATVTNKTGIYVTSCPYFDGIISNNSMFFFNEYAIKIISSVNIGINDNFMHNKYSTLEPIAVDIATCNHININGNTENGYNYSSINNFFNSLGSSLKFNLNGNYYNSLPIVNRGIHSPIITTHSDNSTSLDISGIEYVQLSDTVATTISTITTDSLTLVPRIVTMYSTTGNTSLSGFVSSIKLRQNGSVLIPKNESITFYVYNGVLTEITRSFPLVSTTTISTTATSLDASVDSQFNINQPSATTITSITGGLNGREIVIYAFNGNTTLQHADTDGNSMILKGAVNVTIPNTGMITLRYISSRWREKSRNF